ncbi:MAG: [Proteobacteria bacterium]|nr:[FeFe] hydrogenase H-cluster radical SAM maturase HydE [Pseudomonadota bacterium]
MFDCVIDKLFETRNASDEVLKLLIDLGDADYLYKRALERRKEYYQDDVFTRGLIEFTNYCKNNCYYCGLRAQNHNVERYRLTPEEIYECADEGYELGYRTFVLQGGEDMYFSDAQICEIVRRLKSDHPDCAVTLSIGERERASYQAFYDAGARRYLLRHETANEAHYGKLHPNEMSLAHRKQCLWNLKDIGFQVGSGFMVGSPFQTLDDLVADLRFLQELQPDMIGIGPFIPQADTPFGDQQAGSVKRTLNLIAILRLLFPYALIPSTTALGTLDPKGRELGILAGANVVMPNLSPTRFRKLYAIYDNKICTGDESAQCRHCLEKRVESIGFRLVVDRGDVRREGGNV